MLLPIITSCPFVTVLGSSSDRSRAVTCTTKTETQSAVGWIQRGRVMNTNLLVASEASHAHDCQNLSVPLNS